MAVHFQYIFKVFLHTVEFQGLLHWKPRTLEQFSHLQVFLGGDSFHSVVSGYQVELGEGALFVKCSYGAE